MKSFCLVTALAIVVAAATTAHAIIGETKEQCAARYGEPEVIRDKGALLGYMKGSLVIQSHFHEGKCDSVTYVILSQSGDGNPRPQSEKDMEIFRLMNGGEKKWLQDKNTPELITWFTVDLDLQCVYDRQIHSLTVVTTEYAERQKK
jgi:hypothetical protein